MNLTALVQPGQLWDFFFPPLCSLCEQPLAKGDLFFCGGCWDRCEVAHPSDLPSFKYVDRCAVAFLMHHSPNDPVRSIVHALKYDGRRILAGRMSRRWSRCLPSDFFQDGAVGIPVPQFWARRLQRGFNQSLLLTQELQRELGITVETRLLRRIKHTRSQTRLTPAERRANVRNAFRVSNRRATPESVVLIDDVITTGATMEECARTLKEAGAKWIGALAFAKAKP
jgi:ComF family protein